MPPGSGKDNAFYRRVYDRLQDYHDERMFSHLTDEKNKRQPNTLVALHVNDQAVAIITPESRWLGDLQPVKSNNPKAPLLKGMVERE